MTNGYCFMFPYVTYNSVDEIQDPMMKEFSQACLTSTAMPYHDCAYRA